MLDFLELEETVGRAWHRLIGKTGSWPHISRSCRAACRYTPAACHLLSRFRRRYSGANCASAHTSTHRLGLRQRSGAGEKLAQPLRDGATLMLPPEVHSFRIASSITISTSGWSAIWPSCPWMPTHCRKMRCGATLPRSDRRADGGTGLPRLSRIETAPTSGFAQLYWQSARSARCTGSNSRWKRAFCRFSNRVRTCPMTPCPPFSASRACELSAGPAGAIWPGLMKREEVAPTHW